MSMEFKPAWSPDKLLADKSQLRLDISQNIIQLVDDGATIPFITRYRKDKTGNMDVDQIKQVVAQYEDIKDIQNRIQTVCKAVSKSGKMTKELETSFCTSTSLRDVETLYALYKPSPKGSYAERARAIGLEQASLDIMAGRSINLGKLVDRNVEGLKCFGDIEKGIGHIISDVIAKDKEAFEKLRQICHSSHEFVLQSSKGKGISKDKSKKPLTAKQIKSASDPNKFEQYYSFTVSARSPPSHIVLALNRGEECKALSVKVVIPKSVKFKFIEFASMKFLRIIKDTSSCHLIKSAIDDAYERLMEPTLCRQTRSELTRFAEKQAIAVFASNVKCVLLSPPTRNRTVLGIDPGFRNGCKVAVISSFGSVLNTGVAYLHTSNGNAEITKIAHLVNNHRCEVIAIGNGVACRETEMVISQMMSSKVFNHGSVMYCIVDECGASIYSVSDQAKKDLPELDPTLRGAVSIARRLVDPLAEFVKIEPQHLGVGMYQHDVTQTKLQTALDSVVEECVSFVGVDLNTCSECLLKRVSGLNASRAKKIIEWREKNGAFKNRHQLLGIKGLGEKSFVQCAGFVRIIPDWDKHSNESDKNKEVKEEIEESTGTVKGGRKRKIEPKEKTSKSKKAKLDHQDKCNPLDSTAVHPESYDLALKFVKYVGVDLEDLGSYDFIEKVKKKSSRKDLDLFKDQHDIPLTTVELISTALSRPITYDIRDGSQKPLFKKEIRSMLDLKHGETLTGRVNNVTHFGAFVDVGVGVNGLIYSKQIWLKGTPKTGDHVAVKVGSVDSQRNRISLLLVDVLK